MRTEKYGSPELGDATSMMEEDIEIAVDTAQKWADELMPKVMNREPGTVEMPSHDQHMDWMQKINDPNALMQRFQELATIIGPQKAALELLQWDKRHRAMAQTGKQGRNQNGTTG